MEILSQDDLFQVKYVSLIADYDRQTLIDLYMPIVGYTAISIYFTLWAEAERKDITMFNSHKHLLINMQMATGVFVNERKKLEAVGLLKTCIKKEMDINYYTYQIYAPKTPDRFFNDVLLYGTLIKYIGAKEASKLKAFYQVDEIKDYGDDVTSPFAEVFSIDATDPVYKRALEVKKGEIIDRIQSKIDSEFNYDKFMNLVKSSAQINEAVFTKKLLKEIDRLATLYGVQEETAAEYFIYCYDAGAPRGKKVDLEKMTRMFQDVIKFPNALRNNISHEDDVRVSGGTPLAHKLNMMEDISCKDFLSFLQNGTQPVKADLDLVNDLSLKLGLNTAVINAIIYYTLNKNDNILSRSFVEKIAASVAREKITTAYDTLTYLSKDRSSKRNKKFVIDLDGDTEEKPSRDVKKESSENDDDWEKLMESLGE